jgi:multiple sugar transport system permease protein
MSPPASQMLGSRLAGGSPPRAAPVPRNHGGQRVRHGRYGYVFASPFVACFALLFVLPLGYALYLSLFKNQLVGGTVFAGLSNYTRALKDGMLIAGAGRVALFFVIQVPVMLLLALLAALAIDSGLLRLARLIRLGIFIPYAVPAVVATLMWGYLYGPDFGPAAQLAAKLHVSAPDFLSSGLMLPSLANIVTWEFTGYNMIILYAALRTVPRELYEAAAVDGAGPWRTAWKIKVPALRPALLLCLMFSVIGSFQLFTEPSLLQGTAPTVIGANYTPNLYAYSLAFTSQEPDYAAAVSFLLGLIMMIISYTALYAASRRYRR